jgi:hypothetical protein
MHEHSERLDKVDKVMHGRFRWFSLFLVFDFCCNGGGLLALIEYG